MSIGTNTCPNPSPEMFRELISVTTEAIADVKKHHPAWTHDYAVNYAIDGVAEDWELVRSAEEALRDHFYQVQP